MTRPGTNPGRRHWPVLVVLSFVLAYIVTGFVTLDPTTRFVPVLAAGVTLLLVVADLLRVMLGRDRDPAGAGEGGGVAIEGVAPAREIGAIALVAAAVAAVYYLGFHVAIPLYLFASVRWLGGQPLRTALIVTAVTSLAVFLVFEVALAYNLHRGVLFD
ncbi:MAG: tripartite tricarboxylate transporter TctB family protein [Woeseiaceae bacterium]|nr:tripartite tricarboxylate transporter TctB family protein [Woeseiaceae bacterium]